MDERSQNAATDSGEPKGFEARIAKLKDRIGGVVKKVPGEGLEVGVTVADREGIGDIHVGVEVCDTGTADPHVV